MFMKITLAQLRRRNLRALIDTRFDRSQSSFRDATGISLSQIGQWLNDKIDGSRNMGEKSARRIEAACTLPHGWLDTDHGEIEAISPNPHGPLNPRAELVQQEDQILLWENPTDLPPDELRVWIDRFDLVCSAGCGSVQWEVRQKRALPFTIDFFKAIGSKPEDCKLAVSRGDSMEPFLFDHDMIMIDTSRTTPKDGNVYAICFENEMLVKQLFKQAGGALTLHSYNSKYPDRTVPANDTTQFEIVGQIVYRSGSGLTGM